MAANASLSATTREGQGKGDNRKLRKTGLVPAVIYGHGEKTRSVAVDAHELELLFSRVHVENTVIDLKVEGEKKPIRALVREVQTHPARGGIVHVDFYQIHAGEVVNIQIPLNFVGTAAGVKNGGILQHTMDELDVEVSADNIPENIEVDVSALEIGDSVHVSDLKIPAGIKVLDSGERSVCSVSPPQAGIAEAAAAPEEAAAAPAEPEVIRRKKEDEES
ncbi:MAG TPA: 50S ribosomal protein L25/general stress protein Ctc [Longimicrobiales bacterium]